MGSVLRLRGLVGDHLNWVGGWIHSQAKTFCKEDGKYR